MVISFTKPQLILLIIGLIFYTIIVSTLTCGVDTIDKTNQYQNKIDSLNIELKTIRQDKTILDNKIKSYNGVIHGFNNKMDSLNTILIITQKYYGKKINSIRDYNHTQLNNFFTERYK
jgi:peptidoglycan hydrolase CwlO-like protein